MLDLGGCMAQPPRFLPSCWALAGLTHTFCRSHFHAWERGGTDLSQTYRLPSAD